MLTVTYHNRTLSDPLPLKLQLILSQHAPPRCFQTQALITRNVTTALEMPQHFMMSMFEHRDILPAHPTVQLAWNISSVWWSCHKEPSKLGCRVHFLHAESFLGQIFPARSVGVCLISAWSPMSQLSVDPAMALASTYPALHSVLSTEKRIFYTKHKTVEPDWGENTNYSLRETAVVLSPPRKQSDTKTPTDDQWHELQWQQDRWRTDLKGTSVVEIWSQRGIILVNSSFEHKYYHHQTSAPTTPGSDLDCGQPQPQGHHVGAPQLKVPGSW